MSKKQTQAGSLGTKELRNGEREAWGWGRVTGKWTMKELKAEELQEPRRSQ